MQTKVAALVWLVFLVLAGARIAFFDAIMAALPSDAQVARAAVSVATQPTLQHPALQLADLAR